MRQKKSSGHRFFSPKLAFFIIAAIIVVVIDSFFAQQQQFLKKEISDPAVLGRSYPVSFPDIYANEGKTVAIEGVTAIVSAATFTKNVYLRVDRAVRTNPKETEGLWQVSDLWQVRFRTHDSDDEIRPIETKKNYILSFPYTNQYLLTDQGVWLDEVSLKLARGETADGPWVIFDETVLDVAQNSASILTNQGGFFMVVGGYRRIKPAKSISPTTASAPIESEQTDPAETEVVSQQKPRQTRSTPTTSTGRIHQIESKPTVSQSVKNVYISIKVLVQTIIRKFTD